MSILHPFTSIDEAIDRANDSIYGLGAGIYSSNVDVINKCVSRFKAGNVWVNFYNLTAPQMPFSGYKQSGFSKEVG